MVCDVDEWMRVSHRLSPLCVAADATGAVTRFNASGGLGRTFWRIND
jgi:hypothetical protein